MNKMNVYFFLAILCLIANAIFMFLSNNHSSKTALAETEANLVNKFSELDNNQKAEIFSKIEISEHQLKLYFERLDSNARSKILKSLLPEFKKVKEEIGYSVEEVKQYYEQLDGQSRKKLFEQIKPEFDLVKEEINKTEDRLSNEIREKNDWKLTPKLISDFTKLFDTWKIDKDKNKINISSLSGNDVSHKMAVNLRDYLQKNGYKANLVGTQLVFNGYGIQSDYNNGEVNLWVGRKPNN